LVYNLALYRNVRQKTSGFNQRTNAIIVVVAPALGCSLPITCIGVSLAVGGEEDTGMHQPSMKQNK